MHSTDNLRAVLAQATAQEWQEGVSWYGRARRFVNELAGEFGLDREVVAAAVAAISPSNKWGRNCIDARNLLSAFAAGKSAEDVKVCTYHNNKYKAWAILAENDATLLSGQKVMAFSANLTGDLEKVTVDRHAYNAVIGFRAVVGDDGPSITEKRYREAAAVYAELAAELGVEPAQLQAVIWLAWRRLNVPTRYLDD